jgi:tRNA(adenine34) deaminase
MATDEDFMASAMTQASRASQAGEVPVGAVVVRNGEVIGVGHNAPITGHDPSAHAEIMAMRAAAAKLGNYRLDDCELFVTLEPCAMCAGAMLHARLKRVVFGAADPKTGAAGSVLNLFANVKLNHQTAVHGGVMGPACSAQLQSFFQDKRNQARAISQPVREDAVRTPEERFLDLPGYPWPPQYLNDLPSLAGLRMHYLDEGPNDAEMTWLCLHGNPAWSYLYRKMIPVFLAAGHRVVAPDLIGFGKSDKPKKDAAHSFSWHRHILLEFVERLDLKNIVLVVQDWGGLLGLTLPMADPGRYCGLLAMNTTLATGDEPLSPGFLAWREMCASKPDFEVGRLFARGNPQLSPEECAAYDAPFPDRGHRAALRAFPPMVPDSKSADGAAISRQAREFWRNHWQGQSMMAVGVQDPVLGLPVMNRLRAIIRGCPEPMQIAQGGHFVQEHGETIAQAALSRFSPR